MTRDEMLLTNAQCKNLIYMCKNGATDIEIAMQINQHINRIFDYFEAQQPKQKALVVTPFKNEHPNINEEAFNEWMAYKKYKNKGAITKTLNMLNKYDFQTQQEMVDLSIGNEYKGLFPPKQTQPIKTFKQIDKQEENHKLDRALKHNVFDLIDQKAQQEQGVIDG